MSNSHPTTRRGFIAALGFGGVSLYALWAGYGAAPGPLSLLGFDAAHDDDHAEEPAGHGASGHETEGRGSGGHAAAAPAVGETFRGELQAFAARYRLADGTVYARPLGAPAMRDMPMGDAPDAGHGHAEIGRDEHAAADHASAARASSAIDVYVLAERWSYEPSVLRLDAGRPYRFHMMASDISHGASIQLGRGGRMIRLRPDVVAELDVTFQKPGRHLVYCTVYCGAAHDMMQARIDVV